jgi:hypothetical protein
MIRHLLKIDPAWRLAWWLAPLGVVLGVFADANIADEMVFVAPVIGIAMTVAQRATLFTAALPVPARTLFLARVLATLGVLWLPCLVAIATAAVLGRSSEAAPVVGEIAALLALPVAITFSLRPREFSRPLRQLAMATTLMAAGSVYLVAQASRGVIVAVAAVLSVLLLVRTWSVIPESFQAAPAEAREHMERPRKAWAPAIVWAPVLRSVFPTGAIGLLSPLFLQLIPGMWLWGVTIIVIPFQVAVTYSQWALTLPIPRRAFLAAVFAICSAPAWVGYVLNRFVWFPSAPRTARSIALDVTALLVVQLITANLVTAALHHRLQRLPGAVRHPLSVLGYLPIFVACGFIISNAERSLDSAPRLLAALSGALPSNSFVVIGAGLAAVALLFWSAYRLFERIEAPNLRQLPFWGRMNQ